MQQFRLVLLIVSNCHPTRAKARGFAPVHHIPHTW